MLTMLGTAALQAEMPDPGSSYGSTFVWLAIVVLYVVGLWKTFDKAGQPGWAAIIPIYNLFVLMRIAGRPGWWVLLLLIPLVNFIVVIVVSIDVAKRFGKGTGYGLGLALLPFIFYVILGLSDAQYQPAI